MRRVSHGSCLRHSPYVPPVVRTCDRNLAGSLIRARRGLIQRIPPSANSQDPAAR